MREGGESVAGVEAVGGDSMLQQTEETHNVEERRHSEGGGEYVVLSAKKQPSLSCHLYICAVEETG